MPKLKTYTIEAWWTVIRQAKTDVEARSPEEALKIGRDLAFGDHSYSFIEDNEECDNSDGSTSLTVWTEGMGEELLYDLDEQTRIAQAAPELLKQLKALCTQIAEAGLVIPPGVTAAIAEAEGTEPMKPKVPAGAAQ